MPCATVVSFSRHVTVSVLEVLQREGAAVAARSSGCPGQCERARPLCSTNVGTARPITWMVSAGEVQRRPRVVMMLLEGMHEAPAVSCSDLPPLGGMPLRQGMCT